MKFCTEQNPKSVEWLGNRRGKGVQEQPYHTVEATCGKVNEFRVAIDRELSHFLLLDDEFGVCRLWRVTTTVA
jgi:hypothetical protein